MLGGKGQGGGVRIGSTTYKTGMHETCGTEGPSCTDTPTHKHSSPCTLKRPLTYLSMSPGPQGPSPLITLPGVTPAAHALAASLCVGWGGGVNMWHAGKQDTQPLRQSTCTCKAPNAPVPQRNHCGSMLCVAYSKHVPPQALTRQAIHYCCSLVQLRPHRPRLAEEARLPAIWLGGLHTTHTHIGAHKQ